jgi:ABC-type polysaccharide/polyol phosphate export permease
VAATSEAPASFRSSSARVGAFALVRDGIREVLSRRRLIAYLVRADLKKTGADTLLGNIWWFVDPLLQMLVYVIFVGIILQRGGIPDYPLFVMAAILPWKWFVTAVGDGVTSVVSRERLIKQIYFPKLVLPVATTMAGVASFAFGLVPLFGITVLFYAGHMSPWFLLIPTVAFVQLVFSLAVAILVSAANVFYRDVGNLTRHLLRMWFYLSPALYPVELVNQLTKENPVLGKIFALNPWTVLFTAYRDLLYYGRAPDWSALGALLLVSCVLVLLVVYFFKRAEPSFAKVL